MSQAKVLAHGKLSGGTEAQNSGLAKNGQWFGETKASL